MTVVSGDGAEISSNAIPTFADHRKIDGHCIAPGKPAQNAFSESPCGGLPDEMLTENLFRSLHHAQIGKTETLSLAHAE